MAMSKSGGEEVLSSFSLVTGEDTYASQVSQDPATSRRVQSFIPALSGELTRELNYATLGNALPAAVNAFQQFDYINPDGSITSYYFAETGGLLYSYSAGVWTVVSAVGNVFTIPSFTIYNNQLHMWDGVTAWLFDGNAWVKEGFPIPQGAATFTTAAGTLSILTNRYYWWTWADHTSTRPHESDSSPISLGTGPQTNKLIHVFPFPGTINFVSGSAALTGTGTNFGQWMVGLFLYSSTSPSGVIASVIDATHLTLTLPSTLVGVDTYVIAPKRATHLHIYASESENSQVGKLLGNISLSGGLFSRYDDQSPFVGTTGSLFNIDIDRPLRNDPPETVVNSIITQPVPILTTHKYRIFRRRITAPQNFYFSANEEVSVNANGAPQESYPGQDVKTESDIVNEFTLPDTSSMIRNMTPHGDALYIGTERAVWPLYGETYTDFSFTQHQVFSVGMAGPRAAVSTPFGLAFISYDKKVYLYPSLYMPQTNSTSSLVEIGRPLRNTLEHMDAATISQSTLGSPHLVYYNYGRRNWLVMTYKEWDTGKFRTYVFDFGTQGWFELQHGFTSLAVFDFGGKKILVGGGASPTDGNVYIIDNLTDIFTNPTTQPVSTFIPALIDFGNPEGRRIFRYLEYEVTNVNMTVNVEFWLDPVDMNNLPQPDGTLQPVKMKIGANLFRAYVPTSVGSVCHRLALRLTCPADSNVGALRSIKLVADPVSAF